MSILQDDHAVLKNTKQAGVDCLLHTCCVPKLLANNKSISVFGSNFDERTLAGREMRSRMALSILKNESWFETDPVDSGEPSDKDDCNYAAKNKNAKTATSEDSTSTAMPDGDNDSRALRGVVVCLSGQPTDARQAVERIVTLMGGTTTRRFDPRVVTHLVLDKPQGDKYESWIRFQRTGVGKRVISCKNNMDILLSGRRPTQ